ncbi:MAG: hypothetical protein EZS28_017090 [Streblomastix strix]|uniref:Uncharacterized protein n=1 Tax=Streblomastix strix TaxID=222440 RepID=A0A5J4VYF2_9EUKA|nr:MAG: hypothetical protein EZS28_017090 [Streblomastix strix]
MLAPIVRSTVYNFNNYQLSGTTVIFDQRTGAQHQVDTDDGVLPWGNSSTDSKLQIFPSGYTSLSSLAIYGAISNYPASTCAAPFSYYNSSFFELDAATVLAYYSQNIAPSDLQLYNCLPKTLRILTDAQPGGTTSSISQGCSAGIPFYQRLVGIKSKTCYGTDGQYTDSCKTSCSTVYGQKLRMTGYSYTNGLTETQLQKLMARFGPVLTYNDNAKRYQVYYGWNSDIGQLTFQYTYRVGAGSLTTASHSGPGSLPKLTQVIFYTEPPADCTSNYSVPQFGCKCTSTYNPTGCICPKTPEELLNIPKTECSCITNDQRGSCKTCTGATGDASDCICPTTPSGLLNIPKSKCPCIANDQRGSCKTCTGAAGEASDCICPTTPDGLQNVPKSKCPCISGDLRSDCQPEKCTSSTKPPQGCICSGSYTPTGCICPTAGTDTQGLSTNTCPCIKNDVRSQCQPTACTSSSVPQQGCICSQTASPSGCTCPDNPQDLIGVPIARCPCKDENVDPRGLCQTCTGAAGQASDCICPTTPDGLQNVPKSKCPCISGDLRSDCQPEKCTSSTKPPQGCICSGSYTPTGCICPQTATELIGVDKYYCPCISGDKRQNCQPTQCTSEEQDFPPPQGCFCSSRGSPTGCTCPTDPELMWQNTTLDQCDCILGDYRDVCNCVYPTMETPKEFCPCFDKKKKYYQWKEDPRTQPGGVCEIAMSLRALMSVVATVLILPVFALLC